MWGESRREREREKEGGRGGERDNRRVLCDRDHEPKATDQNARRPPIRIDCQNKGESTRPFHQGLFAFIKSNYYLSAIQIFNCFR